MSQLVIACILFASFVTTLIAGLGWTFVAVYLPVVILLNHLPEVNIIPHVPIEAQYAPLYGILLALPFRRDSIKFHWCSIDTVMLLLLISATLTAGTTELFETAVMTCRNDFLTWYAPYFLARIAFQKLELRAAGLNVLIGLIAILSVSALIEVRLQPYWFLHMLERVGLGGRVPGMAYHRYGFNRVAGPVAHPIYFGNMCLTLLGLVAVLAKTSGRKLTNPWVALAMFGAAGCVLTSISFTPYVGVFAGTLFVAVLMLVPTLRMMILPITLCMFLGLFAISYHLAHSKMAATTDSELEGSLRTRQMIVTESWKKAVNAGPFGFGRDFAQDQGGDDVGEYDLSSVDNTYFMLTMTRGWVYLLLWVSLGVLLALRMTFAFYKATHRSQVFPLVVGISTVLAVMVSMYTVWAGALYVVIWMILLGLCNTLIDLILYPPAQSASFTGAIPVVTVRSVPRGSDIGMLPGGAALHGRTA